MATINHPTNLHLTKNILSRITQQTPNPATTIMKTTIGQFFSQTTLRARIHTVVQNIKNMMGLQLEFRRLRKHRNLL